MTSMLTLDQWDSYNMNEMMKQPLYSDCHVHISNSPFQLLPPAASHIFLSSDAEQCACCSRGRAMVCKLSSVVCAHKQHITYRDAGWTSDTCCMNIWRMISLRLSQMQESSYCSCKLAHNKTLFVDGEVILRQFPFSSHRFFTWFYFHL